MSDFELAQQNERRMRAAGQLHQPGGTVLHCPWPGCSEAAVSGWSCCGHHFSDMHPISRERPVVPPRREDNYAAHLKTPWTIFRALLRPDLDVTTCIALGDL